MELYFDGDRNCIGLKPMEKKSEDSCVVRALGGRGRERNPMYVVSVGKFLKNFHIEHDETKRYVPTWNESEKMWELDLNKPITGESE